MGTVTFTILFVFIADNSPKLTVTTRSFCTSGLPVTEPPTLPVIVGAPPEEMSRTWADRLPRHASDRAAAKMMIRNVFICYGAVTVKVTDTVDVPFS